MILQVVSIIPFVGAIASLFGFGAVLLLAWRVFRQPSQTAPGHHPAVDPADWAPDLVGSAGVLAWRAGRSLGQPGDDRRR